METIKIAKSDNSLAGTNLAMDCMTTLSQAGIMNPGGFELNNEGATEIIIRVTSARVAEVLREELPKKGYKILQSSSPETSPENPSCEKYLPILIQIAKGNEPADPVNGALARAHTLECETCGVKFMEACGQQQEFDPATDPKAQFGLDTALESMGLAAKPKKQDFN
ncbi:MAG: hypothetical protein AAB739_04910 [Patescibacteria group bacterium]